MIGFVLAAIAMLLALIPCGIVLVRGRVMEAVVAFEAIRSGRVGAAGSTGTVLGLGLRQLPRARPMTARTLVADVLLGLAVVIVLASSVGILVMRDVYQKLQDTIRRGQRLAAGTPPASTEDRQTRPGGGPDPQDTP